MRAALLSVFLVSGLIPSEALLFPDNDNENAASKKQNNDFHFDFSKLNIPPWDILKKIQKDLENKRYNKKDTENLLERGSYPKLNLDIPAPNPDNLQDKFFLPERPIVPPMFLLSNKDSSPQLLLLFKKFGLDKPKEIQEDKKTKNRFENERKSNKEENVEKLGNDKEKREANEKPLKEYHKKLEKLNEAMKESDKAVNSNKGLHQNPIAKGTDIRGIPSADVIFEYLMKEKNLLKRLNILEKIRMQDVSEEREFGEQTNDESEEDRFDEDFIEKMTTIKAYILKFLTWRTENRVNNIYTKITSGKYNHKSLPSLNFYRQMTYLLKMVTMADQIVDMEMKTVNVDLPVGNEEETLFRSGSKVEEKKPCIEVERNQLIPQNGEHDRKIVNQNDKPCLVVEKSQVLSESGAAGGKVNAGKPCFILVEKNKPLFPFGFGKFDDLSSNKISFDVINDDVKEQDMKSRKLENFKIDYLKRMPEIVASNDDPFFRHDRSEVKGDLSVKKELIEKNDDSGNNHHSVLSILLRPFRNMFG